MRVSLKSLVSIALFVIIYSGFQGGRYFASNRLQEVGILLAMALFVYGAIMSSLTIKDKDLRWNWWILATIIFIAYTFVLPAQRFAVNADVEFLPSLFASREFLMAMLCPALYFLYRLGYDVEVIEKVFTVTLVMLIVSYLFHYFRIDLKSYYFSSNHALSGLVTYDPWRGYRLKTPSFAIFLFSILAPLMVVYVTGFLKKLLWLLLFGLVLYIWSLAMVRSMLAAIIFGIIFYYFFFATKFRIGLLLLVLPTLAVTVGWSVRSTLIYLSKQDPETDGVRYKSFMIAWNSFLETPFFGFGQQSFYTLTEQQLFWYKFYSSDIGLIGILFKYGAVGALVYIAFSIFLLKRMITTNWAFRKFYNRNNPVLVSLLIIYLAFTINIMLIPVFTYIPGITAASFGIALSSIWQHKIARDLAVQNKPRTALP